MKTQRLRRKSVSVSSSRWLAYATAGAATAVAGVNSSEASIHYSGTLNQVFNAPASSTVFGTFALNNGAVLRFAHTRATTSHPSSHGQALFRIQGAAVANSFLGLASGPYRYPFKLASNVNLNGAAPFITHNGSYFCYPGIPQWFHQQLLVEPSTGFIGFRFNGGSGLQFGWARITMTGAPGNAFTLVDYAWGDAGDQISTGQIPEPGSLALLAVGAVGLLAWRKQRRAKAA